MGYSKSVVGGVVLVMVLFVAGSFSGVSGQQQPACASKLVPCAQYLGLTTTPPDSCCTPLREAVTQDVECLCNLYKNPDLFKSFNINITQALGLPQRCNVTSDLSRCNLEGALPPGTTPPLGTTPPPATPGNNDGSGASTVAWFGMSGLTSLVFLWASIMV